MDKIGVLKPVNYQSRNIRLNFFNFLTSLTSEKATSEKFPIITQEYAYN